MPQKKPGLLTDLARKAKRRNDVYVRRPSIADEVASDAAWERAQAGYAARPSTSEVPWRCSAASCSEWNAAHRAKCRCCGADAAK